MKLTVKQLKRLIIQEVKANYNARNMDKHIGLDQANARFDLDQANAEIYDDGKDENPDSINYKQYIKNDEIKQKMKKLLQALSDLGVKKDELPSYIVDDIDNLYYSLHGFLKN